VKLFLFRVLAMLIDPAGIGQFQLEHGTAVRSFIQYTVYQKNVHIFTIL